MNYYGNCRYLYVHTACVEPHAFTSTARMISSFMNSNKNNPHFYAMPPIAIVFMSVFFCCCCPLYVVRCLWQNLSNWLQHNRRVRHSFWLLSSDPITQMYDLCVSHAAVHVFVAFSLRLILFLLFSSDSQRIYCVCLYVDDCYFLHCVRRLWRSSG